MNIIELAKKCGAVPHAHEDGETYADEEFLEAFATAIIENYKAGLVPVAYMSCDSEMTNFRTDEYFTIPLYALPLGETK